MIFYRDGKRFMIAEFDDGSGFVFEVADVPYFMWTEHYLRLLLENRNG